MAGKLVTRTRAERIRDLVERDLLVAKNLGTEWAENLLNHPVRTTDDI